MDIICKGANVSTPGLRVSFLHALCCGSHHLNSENLVNSVRCPRCDPMAKMVCLPSCAPSNEQIPKVTYSVKYAVYLSRAFKEGDNVFVVHLSPSQQGMNLVWISQNYLI